jgi:Spy/CpxP family protein refolding chaperone
MKRAKKYFGLFLLAGLIFMISNPNVSAQNRQRRENCKFLTEKQQEQVKKIKAKYQKDLTYYNNKLNELNAKQKTLIQVDKPSLKNLHTNIEARTELQNKIAKTRTKMHIEIRNLMTEEQRLMMGARMGKRAMKHRGIMHRGMGNKSCCGKGHGRHHIHKGYGKDGCHGCNNGDNKRMHRKGECNSCAKDGHKRMYRKGECTSCQGKGNFRAQHKGYRANGKCVMNLTEKQQEAFKNLRLEKLKTVNPLKNKLNELRATKHSLMSAEKINNREINKVIDNMSDIKEKIAKANIRQRVEMRKLLTEEQKMIFDKKMHGRRCHGKF